jgi:Flp pilus assembly protein TadD
MPSRESITATIDLDDLELPQRPTSGWNPADEAGRALVEQAVRNAFSPIGGSQRALVQHDRVMVSLKVEREPVTGAQLLDKALRQAGAGKIGAAIDTLQRALRADPANPQIHYNFGVAFLIRKDVDAASIAFVRALGLSPTPSANILLALGNIARGRGDPGRARHFYERAREATGPTKHHCCA